jgi:hypothetical protein
MFLGFWCGLISFEDFQRVGNSAPAVARQCLKFVTGEFFPGPENVNLEGLGCQKGSFPGLNGMVGRLVKRPWSCRLQRPIVDTMQYNHFASALGCQTKKVQAGVKTYPKVICWSFDTDLTKVLDNGQ